MNTEVNYEVPLAEFLFIRYLLSEISFSEPPITDSGTDVI